MSKFGLETNSTPHSEQNSWTIYLLLNHPLRITPMNIFQAFSCMDQNILVLRQTDQLYKFLKNSERFDDPLFLKNKK